MLKEESFDLAQGRHARRSGWAMLEQERTLRGEDIFQFALFANAPHDPLSDIGRDGCAGPISACVFIILWAKFQSVEAARPHALTSFPQMSDPGRELLFAARHYLRIGPPIESCGGKSSWQTLHRPGPRISREPRGFSALTTHNLLRLWLSAYRSR